MGSPHKNPNKPQKRSHVLTPYVARIREEMARGAQVEDVDKALRKKGILVSTKAILAAAYGQTYKNLPGALPKGDTGQGPYTIPAKQVQEIRNLYDTTDLDLDQIAANQGISVSWVTRIATRAVRQDVPDTNPGYETRHSHFDEEKVRRILSKASRYVNKRGKWAEWDRIGREEGCSSVYIYYLLTEQRRKELVGMVKESQAS